MAATATPPTAKATAATARAVAVLAGSRNFAAPGTRKVRLRVTRRGRRMLAGGGTIALYLSLSFVDAAGRAFTASKAIPLVIEITVDDVSVTEVDAGTIDARFTLSLTQASDRLVTVDYATANGSATTPEDYIATSGTAEFERGETAKEVSVAVNGDLLEEIDETFALDLSDPRSATIADEQGIGTIIDDDPPPLGGLPPPILPPDPTVAVDDVTVTEGDADTTDARFTVSLSRASGRGVAVEYGTADGTATAPNDYIATSGTVNFSPGETTKQVAVPVQGDLVDEPDETFTLNLTNARNATIADRQGIGTIIDDDDDPRCRDPDNPHLEIVGTDEPDVLIGTPGPDFIDGKGGDDRIDGLTGKDVICGGAGDDRITGGPEATQMPDGDRVYGGPGNDVIFGGAGSEASQPGPPPALDDVIEGEDGNDEIDTGAGGDVAGGGEGADVLYGRDGFDLLTGGGGNDRVDAGGGDGPASGGGGNDSVYGGPGSNTLNGDDGDDFLDARDGVFGNDRLNGGPGFDDCLADIAEPPPPGEEEPPSDDVGGCE